MDKIEQKYREVIDIVLSASYVYMSAISYAVKLKGFPLEMKDKLNRVRNICAKLHILLCEELERSPEYFAQLDEHKIELMGIVAELYKKEDLSQVSLFTSKTLDIFKHIRNMTDDEFREWYEKY